MALHETDLPPSTFVTRWANLVPEGARVLDVAAGRGRHARLFAARGAQVLAVDRDAEALAALSGVAGVEARCVDLEAAPWPFGDETFDAVIVTNYLHRPLFPALLAGLALDGALIYETFAAGNQHFGRPSNPAFLLEPGELLYRVGGRLRVVAFEQGEIPAPRPAVVQRIAAVGTARAWPPPLAR